MQTEVGTGIEQGRILPRGSAQLFHKGTKGRPERRGGARGLQIAAGSEPNCRPGALPGRISRPNFPFVFIRVYSRLQIPSRYMRSFAAGIEQEAAEVTERTGEALHKETKGTKGRPERRGGARGLQIAAGSEPNCRPGALTGRISRPNFPFAFVRVYSRLQIPSRYMRSFAAGVEQEAAEVTERTGEALHKKTMETKREASEPRNTRNTRKKRLLGFQFTPARHSLGDGGSTYPVISGCKSRPFCALCVLLRQIRSGPFPIFVSFASSVMSSAFSEPSFAKASRLIPINPI